MQMITDYIHDNANLLTQVGGVNYTWDDNGKLLYDGVYTYTYSAANRLVAISNQQSAISYGYNGVGDRLQQTVDDVTTNYAVDIAGGLTQVLSDGTNSYLYGVGRIAQYTGAVPEYFLADALGSVRQLVNQSGVVTLAKDYQPYGEVLNQAGVGNSSYGFTGEITDLTGLIYLRARFYSPSQGRLLSKDIWQGDDNLPMSYNGWL